MALVEKRFGVDVTGAFPFYDEPGKAVYRLDVADGGPLVVRLFPPDRPIERVEGDAEILGFLGEKGLPVEEVVADLGGATTASLDGRGVLVTRLIPGGPPAITADTLEQMGAALGRMHALPVPAPGSGHLARRAGSLPREDLALGREWLAAAEAALPPGRRAEHDALRLALEATHDGEDLPFGLTHPDCHPGNTVQTPEGRVVFFDWDGVGQGPRIAALGVLLYSCAIRAPFGAPTTPDIGRVDHIVAGYAHHASLSAAEQAHLADAIRFRPLVVAARTLLETAERPSPRPDDEAWFSAYDRAEEVAERTVAALAAAGPSRCG